MSYKVYRFTVTLNIDGKHYFNFPASGRSEAKKICAQIRNGMHIPAGRQEDAKVFTACIFLDNRLLRSIPLTKAAIEIYNNAQFIGVYRLHNNELVIVKPPTI